MPDLAKIAENGVRDEAAEKAQAQALIADLGCEDGRVREKARWALVKIGSPAVAFLLEAMKSRLEHVRQEAAEALTRIGDPAAAQAFVVALQDESQGVRWCAAEGLVALRREGLKALLRGLIAHAESPWFREGARHVLRAFSCGPLRGVVIPILEAFSDVAPLVEIPVAAEKALDELSDFGRFKRRHTDKVR